MHNIHMDLSTGAAFVENAMAEHNRLYTDYTNKVHEGVLYNIVRSDKRTNQ